MNVARRRGVSKLLQTISLAREEIGVESMFLLQVCFFFKKKSMFH